jgi:uncharacterized protein (DUF488 family)
VTKARALFTIGYEKATPTALLGELKRAKIDLLIDTRAVAASRKPGFSKRALAASLDEAGIGYLHLQKLGTPSEGRAAARSGNYETLWRIYGKHLKTPEAVEAMDELLRLVKSGQRLCLLCYERNPRECHRSKIAEIVHKKTRLRIEDLTPPLF